MAHSIGIRPKVISWTARKGMTQLELLVAISLIVLLLSLVSPALLTARESARQVQCTARMSQIGKAIHGFDSAHSRLPKFRRKTPQDPWDFISTHTLLLPWLEQSSLHEKIMAPGVMTQNRSFTQTAPEDHPALVQVPAFRCPSDSTRALSNFAYNHGSVVAIGYRTNQEYLHSQTGPFDCSMYSVRKLADIRDGMSNTAAMSERLGGSFDLGSFDRSRDIAFSAIEYLIVANLPQMLDTETMINACRGLSPAPGEFSAWTGESWALGSYEGTWYNHVVGPNSATPYCTTYFPSDVSAISRLTTRGIFKASSLHRDGVNLLICDGSVRMVTNQVDESIWKELGTCNGESKTAEF